MKIKNLIIGAIAGVVMVSCASAGSTPETATEAYVKALAMGECDKALDYSTGSATETIEAMIETGCEKTTSTIVKTSCKITGEIATCICIEQEDALTFKTFKYELEKVEGDWKVASAGKDMPGMPDMGDMGMDDSFEGMEESIGDVGEAVEGAVEEVGAELEEGLEGLFDGLKEAVEEIDTH